MKDRDLLVNKGATWELRDGAEVPFPDSVQALIAARLDTLSADTKSMLADAAVVGKVFWAGAVAPMGDRDLDEVTETLHELSRKELVRLARRSSMEGEAEYAFWHVLARDVAYGQLPRASRAARHVAAAAGSSPRRPSGSRTSPTSSPTTTRQLWSSRSGRPDASKQASSRHRRCRFLILAGERALGLDTAAALGEPRTGARPRPGRAPRTSRGARPLR